MTKLKITDLKKYLKTLTIEELQKEIIFLAKNYKEVKEYYSIKINPESEYEILAKYKRIIMNEFLPDKGFGMMRYKVARDAIKDFQKISDSPKNIAELMLFYAEVGVEFTNIFGDIDDRFYANIEKAYHEALVFICKNGLEEVFFEKAKKIRDNARGIGWGFSDNMDDIYFNYIGYLKDEE